MNMSFDPWAEEKAKTSPSFEAALQLALTYRGHASSEVKRLLSDEPRSVFGHCLRAALIVRTGAPTQRLDLARSRTVIENAGCAEGSLPRLRDAAHALRSCSGNIGAAAMREICGRTRTLTRETLPTEGKSILAELREEYVRVRRALAQRLNETQATAARS